MKKLILLLGTSAMTFAPLSTTISCAEAETVTKVQTEFTVGEVARVGQIFSKLDVDASNVDVSDELLRAGTGDRITASEKLMMEQFIEKQGSWKDSYYLIDIAIAIQNYDTLNRLKKFWIGDSTNNLIAGTDDSEIRQILGSSFPTTSPVDADAATIASLSKYISVSSLSYESMANRYIDLFQGFNSNYKDLEILKWAYAVEEDKTIYQSYYWADSIVSTVETFDYIMNKSGWRVFNRYQNNFMPVATTAEGVIDEWKEEIKDIKSSGDYDTLLIGSK